MWSTALRIHTLEDFVLVDIAEQPLFDLALWKMYDQTIGDLLRTNNAVEGWHRRFQANVGAYHPNFWKFIDILKREQSLNHVNISQARAGHQPEPQRRCYQDSHRRIKNIVQDYHNMDRLQYLRGLAHNISMWRNGVFKNHKTTGLYTSVILWSSSNFRVIKSFHNRPIETSGILTGMYLMKLCAMYKVIFLASWHHM